MADYPVNVGFKSVEVMAGHKVEKRIADDGSVQSRIVGAHITEIMVNHAPCLEDDAREIEAFLMSLRGRVNTCTLSIPDKSTPLGAATGTARVNGARTRGQENISIDGLTAGVTGALKAGDVITFANHTKVYTIVYTVDSGAATAITDESGATITDESGSPIYPESAGQIDVIIAPPLQRDISNDELVTYSGVKYTVKLKSDKITHNVKPPYIYDRKVSFKEVLN